MRISRQCKVCSTPFEAKKSTQLFCCRRCFKRDYYQRTKEKNAALEKKRPTYVCSVCGESSEIPYDPIKKSHRFEGYVCPNCGIPHGAVVSFDLAFKSEEFTVGNTITAQYVVSSAITTITQ